MVMVPSSRGAVAGGARLMLMLKPDPLRLRRRPPWTRCRIPPRGP